MTSDPPRCRSCGSFATLTEIDGGQAAVSCAACDRVYIQRGVA